MNSLRHRAVLLAVWGLCLLCLGMARAEAARRFTLFHTSDWHSRFLGFGPNSEYSPETTNDDDTVGGIARLATVLKERSRQRSPSGPVFVFDGGDFLMGSLFHTMSTRHAFELRAMAQLGYDGVTLGNHDFDWGPRGLSDMVTVALTYGSIPHIVAANTVFSPADPADDALAALAAAGHIRPHAIIEREGLRLGVFGLIGSHAVDVTKSAGPVTFSDPIAAARVQVSVLQAAKVDAIIALSHSGLWQAGDGTWTFEDVELARAVSGVDIIVSGHTHQVVREPVIVGSTAIVQAGSFGRQLGELVVEEQGAGRWNVVDYQLHDIDDSIVGDEEMGAFVARAGATVEGELLQPLGLAFDDAVIETDRTLTRRFDDHLLANLVTDAIRQVAGSDIAFTGNGTIRDDMLRGRYGVQSVADVFRLAPLGIGVHDSAPGYPLIKAYLTAQELRAVVEVFLLAHTFKGPPYFPRVSGLKVVYNPWRVPFDRVVEMKLGNERDGYRVLSLSGDDQRRYSFACSAYVGAFVFDMARLSFGLLDACPTDEDGRPVQTPQAAIIDGQPTKPGVQEVKAWQAVITHLKAFPDRNGNGIADVPARLSPLTQPRIIARPSLAPADMVANATWLQYGAFLVLFLLITVSFWLVLRWRRKRGVSAP